MSEEEIRGFISIIKTQQKKTIKTAYELSRKLRESNIKNSEKVEEGSKKLIEETDPQLTEEGVKKITKKGKIYFRSLKEINKLVHFIKEQFTDFKVPNPSENLSSAELNQFIRILSRIINDINRERAKADSTMGLDFMLKKRSVYVPLGKMANDLAKIRDVQKGEYRIIKTLEDLENLAIDVKNISEKIILFEEELKHLQDEHEAIVKDKDNIENQISFILENTLIKASRQRSIRMTELEIEIGKHLNSFKKIFKKYSREVQRGSFSGDFGLVSTAIAYEENPVKQFLNENENNSEIIALLEELLKIGQSNLHLKQKNIINIRKELKIINQGKLNIEKDEWKEILNEKQKEGDSDEFKALNRKLIKAENDLELIKNELNSKKEEISLKEKELTQSNDSLAERRQRAEDLVKDIENDYNR
jgi:hypothetical protein